MIEQHEFH